MEGDQGENVGAVFRDIRRYFCEYCGICRSKKSLITSHILTHHSDKIDNGEKEEEKVFSSNTCQECGITFTKPAHLKQHMQSHSLERPFACSVDDCHASYRRKDHLNRHILQHQGKLFKCPIESCNREFVIQSNMKRHVNKFHDEKSSSPDAGSQKQHQGKLFKCPIESCNREFAIESNMKRHLKKFHQEESSSPDAGSQKQYVCQEVGCGKVFKYASKLRKHEDSHVKLDSVEAFCSEPGCMKYFTNEHCLKAHVQSCHQHINCEICGMKQLKKNIKRHLQSHESEVELERIRCDFEGCGHTFSTKSNLRQHVKTVHEDIKPFSCSFSGCGMRFSYKHVRDNHEKSGCHIFVPGDFVESDEQFRSRPRGGRKRICPTVEMLIRKRITPPQIHTTLNPEPDLGCSAADNDLTIRLNL